MWLWRTRAGVLLSVGTVACITLAGWVAIGVHRATTPARPADPLPDFESMRIRVTEVEFPAADGVALSGWWIPGEAGMPPILLCHDRNKSKRSMLNLAIALREKGFGILTFDFRGHGASEGNRSSLGVLEKRDVTGALDWLARVEPRRVGVFGAGMGAHAAVLAAIDRPELRVLVLDGLYPDAAYPLSRDVVPAMSWARKGLAFLANGAYFLFHGSSPSSRRAADTIAALAGRDLLMLAPASDSALMDEMREMLEKIPEQVDSDGNLVVVPATLGEGLYGEQLGRYHDRVTGFFRSRLIRDAVALGAG